MRPFVLAALIFIFETSALADHLAIVSHIRRQPVESSAIAAVGYSRKLRALEIEFRNGAIYRYSEVPARLYRELLAADSMARFYDEKIKFHFRSQHVRPRP